MRYSRGIRKEKFITSGAVMMMEVVKGIICMAQIAYREQNWQNAFRAYRDLLDNSYALAVPAGVYFIQNNLAYVALQHLDPATFSVMSQLKLLTAAVFTVIMLRRSISSRKWRALFLLILGVVLIILSTEEEAQSGKKPQSGHLYAGVVAVLAMVSCSGFAGIYFEKVLKSSQQLTLFDRNFQLSVYSLLFGTCQLLLFDYEALQQRGFFYDYSVWTWGNVFIGAVGGIIVAVVVRYADTIMKGFATSSAIIVTSVFGYFYFDTQLNSYFVVGVCVVIISLFNYSDEDAPPASVVTRPPEETNKLSSRVVELGVLNEETIADLTKSS